MLQCNLNAVCFVRLVILNLKCRVRPLIKIEELAEKDTQSTKRGRGIIKIDWESLILLP